jgi:ribosomal-protein-alanine N-acetyltransferase
MKLLETERLVLEPVRMGNARTMLGLMQAPDLREFQEVPRFSLDEFKRRVANRPPVFDGRALGRFEWIITPKDGVPVGWICLRVGESMRGSAELGYTLLAEHRRRGYASEALGALVSYAFETTNLKRVDACCVPENGSSRSVLERAGFRLVRIQRNGAVVRSRSVDILMFEMRRGEWLPRYGSSANSMEIPASVNS